MKEFDKRILKKLLSKEPLILDIGCYDGKDSVEMSKLFKNCVIHCFECDKRSIKLFNQKTKDIPNIFLHEFAMSNVNGLIDFYLSDSDTRRHYEGQESWSASSSIRKPKNHIKLFEDVKFNIVEKVRSVSLDDWFSGLRYIDLIWVDVNGGEEDFIKGGIETLLNLTKYLFIEFSDKELYEGQINKDKLLSLLGNTFEVIDVYNYEGNFGNLFLKNNLLCK